MSSFIDSIFAPIFKSLRQPLESFIRLETADDPFTLVAEDGSLVSIIRVDGARQLIGDNEYASIIEQATLKLGSRFDRAGHALQIHFARDPDMIAPTLRRVMKPNLDAAKGIGLDLTDLFNERFKNLQHYLAHEETHFVLWTRPATLTKAEVERSRKKRMGIRWVVASEAQYPFAALEALRSRHRSFVKGVMTALDEMDMQSGQLDAHQALRAVRVSLFPYLVNERWRPCLPGDPIPARAPRSDTDLSDVLWPPLRHQLCHADAEVISPSVARIGDRIWTGLDVILAPMDPTPFPQLLVRLVETGMPFRVSFLIESGGVAGAAGRKFASAVLGFSNSVNKQIKESLDALQTLSKDEPVVRLRINLATWAHHDQMELLEERVSQLTQATESWGYCQVSERAGDPLDATLSSAIGIACASTAPAAIAPLYEVVKLLPWQRPCSPFEFGSIILRSADGKIWPYQTGSTLTTTWFDLIFAQPGAGKSVLMNAMNLGTILTPGMSTLPFVAIIDIGPSSSGLISLLRDSLPFNRRHEVAHYRLRMEEEFSINPFDTQLGARFPLINERAYLIELLVLLCTPPGQSSTYDGIAQLASLVVDEMYRWRTDNEANAEPRPYLPNVCVEVDEAIRAYNLHVADDAYWWDIVDGLYEKEAVHEATLAQRYASPTLTDAVTAARRPQIRALLEETRIGSGAESVIHAFERMIASSIREFPILSSITRFDIAEARVCALDLGEVAPQGDDTADRQTAIMYMLARHVLVRHWWLGEDAVKHMPELYRPYHEKRVRELRELPKRLCYDEFHRTANSRGVRAQVIRDVREGRKWGVQIVLSSQLLDDFDEDMVDLATGVWVLGSAVSDRSVDKAQERFGLSETARWVMRNRLTGPRPGGAPALLVLGTNQGRYEQLLYNTLGPIELWALSTSAEDVAIRNHLYGRIGASRARKVLAAYYPSGSCRRDIRRRVADLAEQGEIESAALSKVIDAIVNEMVEASQVSALQQAAE